MVVDKIKTGIEGFDEISHGGLPKGRTTLISGPSGSGKTIFSMGFLYHGIIQFDEPGVFVTFEETPEDIMNNMESFGWDLRSLVDEGKLFFVDASPTEEEIVSQDLNLDAILVRTRNGVEQTGAKRVAMDSFSALFHRFEDKYKQAGVIRSEMYKFSSRLKEKGVTSIITAEKPEDVKSIARFGIEEFVCDNVILLHNEPQNGERTRSMEILKLRGTDHETSKTPIVFYRDGIRMYPKPRLESSNIRSERKLGTGITSLDEMLFGGINEYSTTFIVGPTGVGKTTIAMQFLLEGAENGEKGLLIEHEESAEELEDKANAFGWPWKKYVEDGTIRLKTIYPEQVKPEAYYYMIKEEVENTKPTRFVLDSLSSLERIFEEEYIISTIVGLGSLLKNNGITSVSIETSKDLLEIRKVTEKRLSSLTDNIILLKYLEMDGEMKKAISILKVNIGGHEKKIREFTVSDNGAVVGEAFEDVRGLVTSTAEKISPSNILRSMEDLKERYEYNQISQKEYENKYQELKNTMDEFSE
ncbi:MAG: circadian clock protein KaiC [Archaeoglobaceae archaeon]